jgi:hypothetical protein
MMNHLEDLTAYGEVKCEVKADIFVVTLNPKEPKNACCTGKGINLGAAAADCLQNWDRFIEVTKKHHLVELMDGVTKIADIYVRYNHCGEPLVHVDVYCGREIREGITVGLLNDSIKSFVFEVPGASQETTLSIKTMIQQALIRYTDIVALRKEGKIA